MSKLYSSIFLFLLCTVATVHADWSLYRGDERASALAANDVRLPKKLKILWEKRLETDWFQATPIIVHDRIFLGSTDEGFWAFSLKDGKEIWKYPVQYGVAVAATYCKVFSDRNAGEKTDKKLEPTDEAESLELLCFGDSDGTLHAINALSGKFCWKFKTGGTIHNAPNFDLKTNRLLLASEDGSLYALNAVDGQSVWEYKSQDQIRCFPTILGRQCFVAGCDGNLHIIDLDNGTAIARVPLDAPTGSTPTVSGNRIFFGTEGNEFLAVQWKAEAKNAEVIWRYKTPSIVRGPAAGKDDLIVFSGMDRTVQALDVETGKERWTFRTKGRMEYSGPVIVDDRVYVPSSDSFLYVLDFRTGIKLDAIELSGKPLGSPAVVDGLLVIGTDDGVLYCLGE